MTEFLPTAHAAASFGVTYLIHSTILVLSIWLLIRSGLCRPADMRVLCWRMALVFPVLSSLLVSLTSFPGFGPSFAVTTESGPAVFEVGADATPSLIDRAFRQAVVERGESGKSLVTTASAPIQRTTFTTARSRPERIPIWSWVVLTCLSGSLFAGVRLSVQALRLHRIYTRGSPVLDANVLAAVVRLSRRAGLGGDVAVIRSTEVRGPLAGGLWRPFILIPVRFMDVLSEQQRDALLAHELAHVARRDAFWQFLTQVITRTLFFQPLNRLAARHLELETEFVADAQAASMLDESVGLADCLTRLGEWLVSESTPADPPQTLAPGMASFRSNLGRRIETLLARDQGPDPAWKRPAAGALLVAMAFTTTMLAPRAVADLPPSNSTEKDESMFKQIATLALVTAMAMPSAADDKTEATPPAPITKKTPDPLPKGAHRFNGMLVGRIVTKDIEKGTFVVKVDAIPRVWRNSKAENPKSLVGKNILVDGVFGKWLDALLIVKPGETLEFEARHDGADRLTFPGELLRKVAPYKPKDYPVLPEAFRGFHGAVAATVVKKDAELLELIIKVDRVIDTWKKNQAKRPQSIQGKQLMLGGFWRRRDEYHGLEPGDRIEVGLQHIGVRSDHLMVAEFVRKAGPREKAIDQSAGLPAGLRGFGGVLVGRVVEKDVEKGTVRVEVDAVSRVARNSRAKNPKSILGKQIRVGGISGQFLDVLLLVKQGETLEFAARHDGQDQLTFPGEFFRKREPVQQGDFPELPDGARGFNGHVLARVVRKDQQIMELTLEITKVMGRSPKNRAENPSSMIGRKVRVSGFGRQRREAYHRLGEQDLLECQLQHRQLRSDILTVVEFRKAQIDKTDRERD